MSNDNGLLYLAIKKIYPILIASFALSLIIILNWKLYTVTFYKLLCQIPNFLLALFYNFYLSPSSFYKLLPNLSEVITALLLVLKSFIVTYTLDLLYYTPAKLVAINKTINAVILEFIVKAMNNENKYL